NALAWSPDGGHLASGSSDKTVQMWNAISGKRTATISCHSEVHAIGWSPDEQYLALSCEKEVQVWNIATGSCSTTYRNHLFSIKALAWSPNDKCIVSAGRERQVHIWIASNGVQLALYYGHKGQFNWINTVAWSPDGRFIASGDANGTIHVWDATVKSTIVIYKSHSAGVHAV